MNSIEPGLAIGNLEDAMAPVALREQGIRSVLTVSGFPCYESRTAGASSVPPLLS